MVSAAALQATREKKRSCGHRRHWPAGRRLSMRETGPLSVVCRRFQLARAAADVQRTEENTGFQDRALRVECPSSFREFSAPKRVPTRRGESFAAEENSSWLAF